MRPRSTPLLLARLTLFIAEKGLSAAAAVARIAREALEEPAREADAAPAPEPARRERADGRPPAPAPEPEHVDEGLVVVAETAEPGAEEGAGAEVHVDEPWDGYRSMTANDIRARLADADAEVAAAVKLYEGMHKDRSSVVEAADRRLRR
jgi:hypothetical protein